MITHMETINFIHKHNDIELSAKPTVLKFLGEGGKRKHNPIRKPTE
jgi:hypothetical protein